MTADCGVDVLTATRSICSGTAPAQHEVICKVRAIDATELAYLAVRLIMSQSAPLFGQHTGAARCVQPCRFSFGGLGAPADGMLSSVGEGCHVRMRPIVTGAGRPDLCKVGAVADGLALRKIKVVKLRSMKPTVAACACSPGPPPSNSSMRLAACRLGILCTSPVPHANRGCCAGRLISWPSSLRVSVPRGFWDTYAKTYCAAHRSWLTAVTSPALELGCEVLLRPARLSEFHNKTACAVTLDTLASHAAHRACQPTELLTGRTTCALLQV